MVPLLDITRLTSRAGRTLTGVDRVELAYLDHFLTLGEAFGLLRTSLGFVVVDPAGLERFRHRIGTGDWGGVDRLSRLSRRLDETQRAALSSVRRDAIARCRPRGLTATISSLGATDYFNVGHSNLDPLTLTALGTAGMKRHILIHDTIPLDHPHWQRIGTPDRFRDKLDAAIGGADRIIANSDVTVAGIKRHAQAALPPVVVAHLGVDPVIPSDRNPWSGDRPYFVTVGTIEPRKNIGLLVDLFGRLGLDAPNLLVCGSRGWNNDAVFAALDQAEATVIEMAGLSDPDLFAVIRGARAMLFPSFAEGYGLPPIEAAALGVPVVCGDLAIYRETLGDIPIYVDPADAYQWEKIVRKLAEQAPKPRPFTPPTWEAHFKTVLSVS